MSKIVRIIVAGRSANGSPDLLFFKLDVGNYDTIFDSEERHYQRATQIALDQWGYERPVVVFDEHDDGGAALVKLFQWETASTYSLEIPKFKVNDVIIHAEGKYPQGGLVICAVTEKAFSFYPMGGGLQRTADIKHAGDFRIIPPEERVTAYRRGNFTIGDDDRAWAGWWDDMTWNGWAKPVFEEKEALEIFAIFCAEGQGRLWVPAENRFEWTDENGEVYTYQGYPLQTAEGEKFVYPLGTGDWVWEEYFPPEPTPDE